MAFNSEAEFEDALISLLTSTYGWEKQVLEYKTEEDLLHNWADILFENNRGIDRLNDYPLTDGEMQQIVEQINLLKTPLRINSFINGRSVAITRDNPDDTAHFGKEVSLKIYDRQEIAAGQSRYQIARQPKFKAKNSIFPDRRGDFELLINGMPVIHVELKKSGVPISNAEGQIEKYAHEGVFTGLFALVQIFVAMNPEETQYYANPGPEGTFNPDFYFHWADFNNEPINNWKDIASTLLSIPLAHQMIGFYTVADETDGVLKVMRSYQYYAANKISDKVSKHKGRWGETDQLGGYIWHTTGSGKTLTSFKSAQLIANSKDADKVVFLIDRIELGTQSAKEYKGFAEANEFIQETEDTEVLISKLKSDDSSNTLIVTSIQKMSNIKSDAEVKLKAEELQKIVDKRIVFIVDECHRSSFGDMMQTVKHTFKKALFFGFSGTPIQIENEKKGNTTADVFGDELHRYSIADGIRDKNVLGFDPDKVLTFKEKDEREAVALEKAKAKTVSEALSDPQKSDVYYKYMQDVSMAGHFEKDGKYVPGIEDYLLENGRYRTEEHQKMVVHDILDNWLTISHAGKFHAIFATSSIREACQYYERITEEDPDLKVTALFDPSIDNNGQNAIEKEDALVKIIEDYNARYKQTYTIPTWGKMKTDIQNRLAHKKPYERIQFSPDEQIDLLIVVDQMLTGYDSKWINALYLDKVLKYENIIQAFSRTNRLFGQDKPFGTIKYYRAPYTMERNIDAAVKLYSGDKPLGMFAIKLDRNLENMNAVYLEIKNLFESAGVNNFAKLPNETSERKQFAKLFIAFNEYLEAAKVQGFIWDKLTYEFDVPGEQHKTISLELDENTYKILVLRYKELFGGGTGPKGLDTPYDLKGYLTTIDTKEINSEYMNSRFEKYRKALETGDSEAREAAKQELHKTFASLSFDEQKYANILLHDIETGDVEILEGKSLRDYINEYMEAAKNDQIHKVAVSIGVDETMLRDMISLNLNESNINEFGRFDALKATVDISRAKEYFERISAYAEQLVSVKLPIPKVKMRVDKLLRDFIIMGGVDIMVESDFSSYGKAISKDQFFSVDGVAAFSNSEWTYYFSDDYKLLNESYCGKWMYFYSEMDFAKHICLKAILEGACLEAKHANGLGGVCCFYINGNDLEAHKKLIRFFMDNELIRKTSEGKYYNISFKYDSQTHNGEYGTDFQAEIKLDDFVDLKTGEWK